MELAPTVSTRSSNLAFALLWLPKARRSDAMVFYRFCRAVDDIADEPGRTPEEKTALLDEWLDGIDSRLPQELEGVVERHSIDRELLKEIVRGCAMDIVPARYGTQADLDQYCWRVACAVGLVSIRIFGCTHPDSENYATQLGHALQMTNILRDVAEDAANGRVYLAAEDLASCGVAADDLLAGRPGPGFLPLMRLVAGRARARFAAAIPPTADRRALIPSEIMRSLYARILSRLETTGFPVFQHRVGLSKWEKLAAAAVVVLREWR